MRLRALSSGNFKPYGLIIEYPKKGASKKGNLFKIIIRQPGLGWRIAYLVVRDKSIVRMESHPSSLESFEPCGGKTMLFVSKKKDPVKIDCFILDKPVILKRGVWHGVIALGGESEIKIVENSRVKSLYWRLGFELNSSHSSR